MQKYYQILKEMKKTVEAMLVSRHAEWAAQDNGEDPSPHVKNAEKLEAKCNAIAAEACRCEEIKEIVSDKDTITSIIKENNLEMEVMVPFFNFDKNLVGFQACFDDEFFYFYVYPKFTKDMDVLKKSFIKWIKNIPKACKRRKEEEELVRKARPKQEKLFKATLKEFGIRRR